MNIWYTMIEIAFSIMISLIIFQVIAQLINCIFYKFIINKEESYQIVDCYFGDTWMTISNKLEFIVKDNITDNSKAKLVKQYKLYYFKIFLCSYIVFITMVFNLYNENDIINPFIVIIIGVFCMIIWNSIADIKVHELRDMNIKFIDGYIRTKLICLMIFIILISYCIGWFCVQSNFGILNKYMAGTFGISFQIIAGILFASKTLNEDISSTLHGNGIDNTEEEKFISKIKEKYENILGFLFLVTGMILTLLFDTTLIDNNETLSIFILSILVSIFILTVLINKFIRCENIRYRELIKAFDNENIGSR